MREISYFDSAIPKIMGVIGLIVGFLFGDWVISLSILVTVQALDIFTGILKGTFYEDGVSSKLLARGITKKMGMWIVVILAHLIDLILFDNSVLQVGVVFTYIANEGLSIVENLGAMDILVPQGVIEYLQQVKTKADK